MKKGLNVHFVVTLIAFGVTPNILARHIPAGFESFFNESIETVEVSVAGITLGQSINALISYDSFSINQDQSILIVKLLTNASIKSSEIDAVIAELTNGINFSSPCEDGCVANDQQSSAKYFFDYDNHSLTIFASSEMFDTSPEKEYHSPFSSSNALINETSLYVFSNNNDNNYNWSNDTTLGLPYGHLNLDSQYVHQQRDFNIITGVYDIELSGHRLTAGYQQLGSRYDNFNSSDFLQNGANYTGYGISVGSSDKLLKGASELYQKLNFYTPQTGQLEIYRDDKLIYTQVVMQGQNEVSYAKLPKGVYVINFIVKQGTQEIINESRPIVNNNDAKLAVGDFDYKVRVGHLDKNINYAESSFSHRFSEKSLLGITFGSDFDNYMLRLGGKYYFSDISTLQYTGSIFDSGSWYQQAHISIGALSFNANYIGGLKDTDKFSNALYGDYNSLQYGISYSSSFFGGNVYASFYHLEIDNKDVGLENDNISLSWNRSLFGGRFGLNANYVIQKDREDTFSVNMNWSYDFTDKLSYASAININNNGFDYITQDITLRHSWYEYDGFLNIKAKRQDDQLLNEISAFGNGSNSVLHYNSYAFYNTDKNYSVSGNLRSTQILTQDDLSFTSTTGRSFVKVNPQWTSTPDDQSEISYAIYKDGKVNYSGAVGADESFIVALPEYSNVRFELDTEYSNVEVDIKAQDNFTMPGTQYILDNQVTALHSQVFLLNDINGNSVLNAECAGEGCKSVNGITDGVYRVTYRDEQSFYLISQNRVCVFNPEHFGNAYVYSYCLEGLTDLDENSSLVYNDMKYMGVYESTKETLKIIARLEELGLTSRYVAVGNQLYVYVRYESAFTLAQAQALGQLEAYLVSTKFKPENMFSVTKL